MNPPRTLYPLSRATGAVAAWYNMRLFRNEPVFAKLPQLYQGAKGTQHEEVCEIKGESEFDVNQTLQMLWELGTVVGAALGQRGGQISFVGERILKIQTRG